MTYKIWDKKEYINGKEPSYFLNREPFKSEKGDIILIYNGDRVSQVECKSILAKVYSINANLDLDTFMYYYFESIKPVETPSEE